MSFSVCCTVDQCFEITYGEITYFMVTIANSYSFISTVSASPLGLNVDHGKMSVKRAEGLCFINRYDKINIPINKNNTAT